MMNKEQKKNYIAEMTTQFENSKAVMVTHYQGLTMTQLDELRSKMREHGIIFKITKNRITKLALEKTKCKDLSNLFTGPTAVASCLVGSEMCIRDRMQLCQHEFYPSLQKIMRI